MQISKKQHGCELVLDLEPKDMYHCHPYHFMEICKPVNGPIGSYQIHHLKTHFITWKRSLRFFMHLQNFAMVGKGLILMAMTKKNP